MTSIELPCDQKVRFERPRTGRKGLHRNSERHVWFAPGGHPRQQRNLAKEGYRPTTHTHGLWTHDTRPISFSVVVDNFGVKCVGRGHAEHLMTCIKKNNSISSDWNGTACCGLTLDWDYKDRTVDLSMPEYIKAALQYKYQHPAPALPEHSPHTWNPTTYGANT
jgi:hypothetical protein